MEKIAPWIDEENKNNFKKELKKAKNQAINKILREYYYDAILKDPEKYMKYAPIHEHDPLCNYIVKRTGQRWRYFMATINFKPDIDIKIAMKKLTKCLKKKWIKDYYYCWEWRKINDGMHIHLRIEPDENKKIYDCKREIYNTFKHLVGNKMHVNMRYSNKENCFIDYINGLKDNEPKDCFEATKEMRIKYNINDIYMKTKG